MDKTALVGIDPSAGREFLTLLQSAGMKLDAALWQWDELSEKWNLLMVTPEVESSGVRGTYKKLIGIVSAAARIPGVDLLSVTVMTPKSAFFRSLRKQFRGAVNLPVAKQPVGDHVLDDGFIYFVK